MAIGRPGNFAIFLLLVWSGIWSDPCGHFWPDLGWEVKSGFFTFSDLLVAG